MGAYRRALTAERGTDRGLRLRARCAVGRHPSTVCGGRAPIRMAHPPKAEKPSHSRRRRQGSDGWRRGCAALGCHETIARRVTHRADQEVSHAGHEGARVESLEEANALAVQRVSKSTAAPHPRHVRCSRCVPRGGPMAAEGSCAYRIPTLAAASRRATDSDESRTAMRSFSPLLGFSRHAGCFQP